MLMSTTPYDDRKIRRRNRVLQALIVDDDAVDLELTRRLLGGAERMRFRIDTAMRLKDAIELVRTNSYDILLLDLNLPRSRGLSTLDAVRAESDDVPIIVLSGLTDELTALQSLDHGAQDYLVKGSVTTDTLEHSIRYAIQRQHLLHEISHAKDSLELKNQRLADLYETAHRFVDNVSHEFRTPLTVIKEYTSLIRDGLVQSDEERDRFLDIVADRADDLNTMVDDMLDISKLEAGLLSAWRKNCSIEQIITDLKPSLERKAAVKGVSLETDVDPELPDVYCDEEKVGRVLINLSVNAIKFCQENGRVRIWARPEPDGVVIGVSDNGPGIDDEGIARIFERFQQVNGSVRGSCKGFGLGLNIAKELVDLNLGEMSVESEVGEGSTFTFTLPVADPMVIMGRYLKRISHLRNGSTEVTLIDAQIVDSHENATTEDINAYLHYLLQRNDLVFRVRDDRWLLVLPTSRMDLPSFFEKAEKTRHDMDRNRIQGPLPLLRFETLGTWHVKTELDDVYEHLQSVFDPTEDHSETKHEDCAEQTYADAVR